MRYIKMSINSEDGMEEEVLLVVLVFSGREGLKEKPRFLHANVRRITAVLREVYVMTIGRYVRCGPYPTCVGCVHLTWLPSEKPALRKNTTCISVANLDLFQIMVF
jgi:hypothetical protein